MYILCHFVQESLADAKVRKLAKKSTATQLNIPMWLMITMVTRAVHCLKQEAKLSLG